MTHKVNKEHAVIFSSLLPKIKCSKCDSMFYLLFLKRYWFVHFPLLWYFHILNYYFRFSPVHNITLFFRWQRNSNYGKLNKNAIRMNSKIVQKCILYACFGLFCYFSGRLFPLGICGETKKKQTASATFVHGCRCRSY